MLKTLKTKAIPRHGRCSAKPLATKAPYRRYQRDRGITEAEKRQNKHVKPISAMNTNMTTSPELFGSIAGYAVIVKVNLARWA
jgi:hypothetical protein